MCFVSLNPFLPDVSGGKAMLEQLSSINWSDLSHAYGSAEDVPQLLRDLTSPHHDPVGKKKSARYQNPLIGRQTGWYRSGELALKRAADS